MTKEPSVIIPVSTEKDSYGNLNVTDTEGNVTRINKKHESLHPLLENNLNRAIKLYWNVFQGKDYVENAELFDGKPPVPKPAQVTAGVVTGGTGVDKPKDPPKTKEFRSPQEFMRTSALSCSKDIAVAKLTRGDKDVTSEWIIDLAKKFNEYLDGGIK